MDLQFWKEVIAAVFGIVVAVKLWIDNRQAQKAREAIATQLKEKEQKEIAEKERHAKISSVEFNNELNRDVTHETRKIRDRYQAMRVYVIHFSNGTVTEANLHLQKISFKHEVVIDWQDQRVEALSRGWQEEHMPDMFLQPMARIIRGDGEYYLRDRETLDLKDAHCRDYYYWLKAYKVFSTRWLAIRNSDRKIIAILVSDWPATTDLDETVLTKIDEIKRTIEGIYRDKLE